jgi:hypothetical protein
MDEQLFKLVMAFITTADEVIRTDGYNIAVNHVMANGIIRSIYNLVILYFTYRVGRKGIYYISFHRLINNGMEEYDGQFGDYYKDEYVWLGFSLVLITSIIAFAYVTHLFANIQHIISPEWYAISEIIKVVR